MRASSFLMARFNSTRRLSCVSFSAWARSNAAGIHGGVIEEFEPVFRTWFDAQLLRPGAERVFVARRGQHFALDLAPVAGVAAALQTEFAQAQALTLPDLLYEFAKHSLDFMLWLHLYH